MCSRYFMLWLKLNPSRLNYIPFEKFSRYYVIACYKMIFKNFSSKNKYTFHSPQTRAPASNLAIAGYDNKAYMTVKQFPV